MPRSKSQIKNLSQLRKLDLQYNRKITDEGLKNLSHLKASNESGSCVLVQTHSTQI